MSANAKPVKALSRRVALSASALRVIGIAAICGLAAPAFAGESTSFVAPSAPFVAVASIGSIANTGSSKPLSAEPAYETIASGTASYYGRELAGNRTASGERFNPSGLTAAHRTLPLGSKVRVTNSRTGDSVIVRINDRGPFHGKRLIDLSEAAARIVGIRAAGSGRVDLAIQAR